MTKRSAGNLQRTKIQGQRPRMLEGANRCVYLWDVRAAGAEEGQTFASTSMTLREAHRGPEYKTKGGASRNADVDLTVQEEPEADHRRVAVLKPFFSTRVAGYFPQIHEPS